MASFYDNLRQSNKLPKWGVVSSPDDTTREFQSEMQEKSDYERKQREDTQKAIEKATSLRDTIKQISDGKVTIDKNIYDEGTLKKILASVLKMKQFNDGTLFPAYTNIKDFTTEETKNASGMMGYAQRGALGTKNSPYKISLNNANNSSLNDWLYEQGSGNNWNVKVNRQAKDTTAAHELSHSTQYEVNKKVKDPALTMDYAEKIKRQNFKNTHLSPQQLFDKAAKNTGFKDVAEAAMGISGYAAEEAGYEGWATSKGLLNPTKDWRPQGRLPEVFAEAYVDVLYNGDNANSYSKELIKLYTEYVNDYQKTFGRKDNKNIDNFKHALGILPPLRDEENFIKNLRRLYILPQE